MARDVDIGWPRVGSVHIADAKVDYSTPDLDTEAEVIVAVNATNTIVNSALAALEGAGIVAAS